MMKGWVGVGWVGEGVGWGVVGLVGDEGVAWGMVGWVGDEGVGWGGVCHIGVGWGGVVQNSNSKNNTL